MVLVLFGFMVLDEIFLSFDFLDSPIKKINSADVPMPYSSVLEKKYLPQVEDIILAIEEVCYIQ